MRLFLCFCISPLVLVFGTAGHKSELPERGKPQGIQSSATVRIRLLSSYGTELQADPKIDLFQDESSDANWASQFNHGVAHGIPYGEYRMRLFTRGFRPAEREIRVFQPEVLGVVSLEMGGIDFGQLTSSVVGKVRSDGKISTTIILRLFGLYSGTVMDTNPKPDGTFEFAGVPQGVYILTSIQLGDLKSPVEAKVLDYREISVPTTADLLIELRRGSK